MKIEITEEEIKKNLQSMYATLSSLRRKGI